MARIWSSGFESSWKVLRVSLGVKEMNITDWMKRQERLVKLIRMDEKYKETLESIVRKVKKHGVF